MKSTWLTFFKSLFIFLIIILCFGLVLSLNLVVFLNYRNNFFGFSLAIIALLISSALLYALIRIALLLVRRLLRDKELQENTEDFELINILDAEGIGIAFFSTERRILKASDFIIQRFGEGVINENVAFFLPEGFKKRVVDSISLREVLEEFNELQKKVLFKDWSEEFRGRIDYLKASLNSFDATIIKHQGSYLRVNFFWNKGVLTIKDISELEFLYDSLLLNRSVIGEVQIDNFQSYQDYLTEEEIFQIRQTVAALFERLAESYDICFKNYQEGRYLLLLNEAVLLKWCEEGFSFFRDLGVKNELKITLSVGFGKSQTSLAKLEEAAKEGLEEAQLRGGNQVCIIGLEGSVERFGSESKIESQNSRIEVNNFADKLLTKLNSKRIKRVLIYGHIYSDFDSLAATYTLYLIAKKLYKKEAFIQNQIFSYSSQYFLNKHIKNWKQSFIDVNEAKRLTDSTTLVIICDANDSSRLENPDALINVLSENVFIIDHHLIPNIKNLKNFANVYIETTISSASEIITEILLLKRIKGMPRLAYQLLLNGIYVDTNRLQANTSSRTFEALAYLRKQGATIESAVELFKVDEPTKAKIDLLLANLEEIKPGFFLSASKVETSSEIISLAADKALEIKGREASFVIAKLEGRAEFKLSARGVNVNVQSICEAVGGGGHFNTAAASFPERDFDSFVDDLKQAIVSTKPLKGQPGDRAKKS